MSWFFGPEAWEILAPWPGTEPTPFAVEGEVLTTGSPGKSQQQDFDASNYLTSEIFKF